MKPEKIIPFSKFVFFFNLKHGHVDSLTSIKQSLILFRIKKSKLAKPFFYVHFYVHFLYTFSYNFINARKYERTDKVRRCRHQRSSRSWLTCDLILLSVAVTSGTQHKYLILIINDTIDYFNEQRMEHEPCRTSCPGTAARPAAQHMMKRCNSSSSCNNNNSSSNDNNNNGNGTTHSRERQLLRSSFSPPWPSFLRRDVGKTGWHARVHAEYTHAPYVNNDALSFPPPPPPPAPSRPFPVFVHRHAGIRSSRVQALLSSYPSLLPSVVHVHVLKHLRVSLV